MNTANLYRTAAILVTTLALGSVADGQVEFLESGTITVEAVGEATTPGGQPASAGARETDSPNRTSFFLAQSTDGGVLPPPPATNPGRVSIQGSVASLRGGSSVPVTSITFDILVDTIFDITEPDWIVEGSQYDLDVELPVAIDRALTAEITLLSSSGGLPALITDCFSIDGEQVPLVQGEVVTVSLDPGVRTLSIVLPQGQLAGSDLDVEYTISMELRDGPVARTLQQTKLFESNPRTGMQLGFSSAADGDTVAFGSPYDSRLGAEAGLVTVFRWMGEQWVQEARLAPDDLTSPQFGRSIAIDGDTLVAGTLGNHTFIFERDGDSWTQVDKLELLDVTSFGSAVDIEDNTLVVAGSARDGMGESLSGGVYVYERRATGWELVADLQDQVTLVTGSRFGYSVSIDGERIAVGARNHVGPNGAQGTVFVFERVGGQWTLEQEIWAASGVAGDRFGRSVSIEGNWICVGAPRRVVDIDDEGSVYAFELIEGKWTEQQLLVPSDVRRGDLAGYSVSIRDGWLAVGSVLNNRVTGPLAADALGAAYLYSLGSGGWTERKKVTNPDGSPGDRFGFSVALSESMLAVGAPSHTVARPTPVDEEGSGFVLHRTDSTTWVDPPSSLVGDSTSMIGGAIAASSDYFFFGGAAEGAATESLSVFARDTRDGRYWTELQTLSPPGQFGFTGPLALSIDQDRLVVGAFDEQAAYVFVLDGSDWVIEDTLFFDDGFPSGPTGFGSSVAISGEYIAVGMPSYDSQGGVAVFKRGGSEWILQTIITDNRPLAMNGQGLGASVAIQSLGPGSGTMILAGAPSATLNIDDLGSVLVLTGADASWTIADELVPDDGQLNSRFGSVIALEGDKVTVGAPGYGSRGAVYEFESVTPTNWVQRQRIEPVGTVANQRGGTSTRRFGSSLARDSGLLLVGEQNLFGDLSQEGVVHAYYERPGDGLWVGGNVIGPDPRRLRSALQGDAISFGTGVAISNGQALITVQNALDPADDSFLPKTESGASEPEPISGVQVLQADPSTWLNYARSETGDVYTTIGEAVTDAAVGDTITASPSTIAVEPITDLAAKGLELQTLGVAKWPAESSMIVGNDSRIVSVTMLRDIETHGDVLVVGDEQASLEADSFVFGPSSHLFIGDSVESPTLNLLSNGVRVRADITGEVSVGNFSNFTISGDVSFTRDSSLLMDGVSYLQLRGNFSSAVQNIDRHQSAEASLRFYGADVRTMEAMSAEESVSARGGASSPYSWDRIAVAAGTLDLVDEHDNDGMGFEAPETVIVGTLTIGSGATLNTNGLKLYYDEIQIDGVVDDPANLVRIGAACIADIDGDDVVGSSDLAALLAAWGGSDAQADLDGDGVVAAGDLATLLAAWGACP